MSPRGRGSALLLVIAGFKLLKAALLVAVAVGAHKLVRGGGREVLVDWVRALRVDPDNRIVHAIVSKLTGLSDRQLRAISLGTLLYAGLFATEGVGLLLRKRWAEYLTVIATALLLPVEVYELARHPSVAKVLVLVANVAIAVYLIYIIRQGPRSGEVAKPDVEG
jgi:uncharacterized membrane protein (DUF2068 family)